MGDPEPIGGQSSRSRALKTLRAIAAKEGLKARNALAMHSNGADDRDRAFIMELVYGVLRKRDYIDWLLGHFIKSIRSLPENTINNLRMAVYQILFMRVPERAAVFESVQLEKQNQGKPSLVNGVLRNFLRRREHLDTSVISNPLRRIAIETSHPLWLIKRWAKRYGIKDAQALAQKNNERPSIAIRFKNPCTTESALRLMEAEGINSRSSEYCPNCLVLENPPGFQRLSEILGVEFVVQDEASQMVSLLLNPQPGMKALDACSSPGGKAAHLAALMNDIGCVYAVEINNKRFELLKENIHRLSLKSIVPIHTDVRDLQRHINIPAGGLFDRILLDAPCSCLGVIRRNPDVKYRHMEEDLKRFAERQKEMLALVSRFLKPEGLLLYSVCSTEPEEGEEVIDWFLQKNDSFINIVSPINRFSLFIEKYSTETAFYRTYPHRHNMDGFFAALIKRDQ